MLFQQGTWLTKEPNALKGGMQIVVAKTFYANSDFLLEKSQDEREFHKACWTAMHQSVPIKTASYQGSVGKLSAARRALLYTRHQRDYSHEVFFARFCNCRRRLQQHHPCGV